MVSHPAIEKGPEGEAELEKAKELITNLNEVRDSRD